MAFGSPLLEDSASVLDGRRLVERHDASDDAPWMQAIPVPPRRRQPCRVRGIMPRKAMIDSSQERMDHYRS
jgi:hypothetical protein